MKPIHAVLFVFLSCIATASADEVPLSPLGNRSWGVEISPVFLFYQGDGGGLVGTLSNFSIDRSAELALPFLYLTNDLNETRLVHLDLHYRRFFSGIQRGLYVTGFTRYQHVIYFDANPSVETDWKRTRLDRFGAGLGLGARFFWKSGFYWGWSIYGGRYFSGNPSDHDYPDHVAIWSGKAILDLEFVKIGYAF